MCATAQDGSRLVKPAPSPSQPQSPLPATSGAGSACCSISPSVAAVHSPALYGSSTVSSSPSSNCCTSTASPPALPACALPDCAQTSPQQQQQQGRGPAHLDQGAPAAAAAMHLATPFAAAEAEAEAGPSGVQEADSDTEATPADIAATAAAEEPGTRPGAGVGGTQQPGPGQAAPCILKELGVSGPSLVRLLTGDCAVESQQPVWMVVNLQVCVCVCVSERVPVSVCVGHLRRTLHRPGATLCSVAPHSLMTSVCHSPLPLLFLLYLCLLPSTSPRPSPPSGQDQGQLHRVKDVGVQCARHPQQRAAGAGH